MTMLVRPLVMRAVASVINCSLRLSTLLVASSSTSTLGRFT